MYLRMLRDSPVSNKILFAALVILICGIIVMGFGFAAGCMIFGMGLTGMQSALSDLTSPQSLAILKYFQVVQSFGLFIIPPFIIAWFIHGRPSVFLKYKNFPLAVSILLVIAIIYCADPLINWLTEFNSKLSLPEWMNSIQTWIQEAEDQADKITKAFLATQSTSDLLTNLFVIGILPAVGEELLFRGVVQQLFKKLMGNAHAAIWISAAIFSALHLQFFGFLPRMILGAMFGYMLEWSGTLWLPIIAHFVNNATAVVAYYLADKGIGGTGIENIGTSSDGTSYLVLISLGLLFILFRALYLKRVSSDIAFN
jgi:membrane protease YdiL (CAAX protease family)